jgi:thiol-disulfide isomerase/thioredoxin
MTRFFAIIFFLALLPALSFSQKVGYQIKAKIDGFSGKECYLGYYFGDKQYLKDTAYVETDGWFYFEGTQPLEGGVYLLVMPPDNQFIQIVADKDNQWFSIETKLPESADNMKVKNSPDNQLFYEYLRFLSARRPEADTLRKQIAAPGIEEKKKKKLEDRLKQIDDEVVNHQKEIIAKHPKTMTAAIIKGNIQPEIPKYEGEEKEVQRKQFHWLREHWFDNMDLTDPRMLRTPFLYQKIDHYIQKMTLQHPDSLNIAIDKLLKMVEPAEETFKFYLIHFLNFYAKSNIVGMDAVYVHIVDNYYATNRAPWTEKDQLDKIIDNAGRLRPLLIGKVAPNIQMETQQGERMNLHDFRSPFTVLFFWDPECGHCKKSMPEMVKFAKDYKDKGVSVFAVCTKLVTKDDQGNFSMKEVDSCWSTIKEREMDVFFNTVDPYHRSRYKTVYDIKSTPQIYVLDHDKKILSKRIGAEQLPEVLTHFIEMKEKR